MPAKLIDTPDIIEIRGQVAEREYRMYQLVINREENPPAQVIYLLDFAS